MKTKILLCLITLVPLACAAHKSRRHVLDREQRARLHRAIPRVYIKRVYRVADGQAESGVYQLTLEGTSDLNESPPSSTPAHAISAWTQRLNPLKKPTPYVDSSAETEATRSIVKLEALLQSAARPLPERFQGKGETGTLVQGNDLPEGCYEAVIAPDQQGKPRLAGWRLVEEHRKEIQTAGVRDSTPQAADLYELVFEQSVMIFRPVSTMERPKGIRPAPKQGDGVVPVNHEEEAIQEETTQGHSQGPTSADKMLSDLQRDWQSYLPPPWGGRLFVPVQPTPEGKRGMMLYYEGQPLQWEDGRWIPQEPKTEKK